VAQPAEGVVDLRGLVAELLLVVQVLPQTPKCGQRGSTRPGPFCNTSTAFASA
jgi:hypothetical protein